MKFRISIARPELPYTDNIINLYDASIKNRLYLFPVPRLYCVDKGQTLAYYISADTDRRVFNGLGARLRIGSAANCRSNHSKGDFSDEFPTYTNTEVRNRLGRFLFDEEDISKRVCDLSGGEKVRLCLSKIFERKPNLLILDEPTNHLDILGKESLEEILNSFEGTVIFVSHDRYFVKKIANKVLYFERCNRARIARPYESTQEPVAASYASGTAHQYEEAHTNDITTTDDLSNKDNYELNKQKNKDKKRAKKLEDEIDKIENDISELKNSLMDEKIQSDFLELTKINNKIEELNSLLENKYSEWEKMSQ